MVAASDLFDAMFGDDYKGPRSRRRTYSIPYGANRREWLGGKRYRGPCVDRAGVHRPEHDYSLSEDCLFCGHRKGH